MRPHQILLVKNSLEAAAPQRHRIARFFFAELFRRDPSLRPVFEGDLAEHAGQLFDGLTWIVESLDRLYPILPVLEWLAVHNRRRGIGERQYAAFGEALLATLAAAFGDGFGPELREAWTAAHAKIVRAMVRAAMEPLAA